MHRRIALSIALALSVALLSLMSSGSTAQAQQQIRFRADTGLFTLGQNQVLRLTAVFDFNNDGDVAGADFARVRFRRMKYVEADNVYQVAAQDVTDPVTLRPGEAASIVTDNVDPDEFLGRVVVESNRRNVRATATIINTLTGETASHIIMANTEGD